MKDQSHDTYSCFTLSRTWFCLLSLPPLHLVLMSLSYKHVRLCPPKNTQKNQPLIFMFLYRYCSISLFAISTFSAKINGMNFNFMSLPPIYSHPTRIWFSVLSHAQQGSSVDIPNGYFSIHILWDPSCIDLIDQSFLLETLSALLLCPQQAHVFFISRATSHLSHFSLFLILSSLSSGAPHSLTFVFPFS